MADLVEYSIDGVVALIRLNRPPVNALSEELSQELLAAFEQAADPSVRAVVITGQPHFAAGADIKGFQEAYASGKQERLASSLSQAILALEGLAKPVIAAVHGYALGGGLELAMGADFRYLAEDAQVGQPEIKLGLIPGAGGTQRLQRLAGHQRAKEIIYSGRFVNAAEAHEIGLADKVAPTDELLGLALTDAARWAEGPTPALAAAKRALHGGWGRPLTEALAVEAEQFNNAFWTIDAKEGVAAFIEKRQPLFTGH
ncbi:MAG: enoyl-CoA hydratase/isomerase family protein [Acidimicrobiia bacterium]|nr:enoyl-CoA hydratase/isomerase family protein [Acidimicrobiia bacterium]